MTGPGALPDRSTAEGHRRLAVVTRQGGTVEAFASVGHREGFSASRLSALARKLAIWARVTLSCGRKVPSA